MLRLHGLSVAFTYVWSVGQGIRRFVLGLVSGLLPAASNAAQGVFTVTNNHSLIVSQLKAGVINVRDGSETKDS